MYFSVAKQEHHLGKHWYCSMAREYPRFLFSNPQNTKSEGPFVIHLLEPRLVFKVVDQDTLICLDIVYDTNQAEKISADALRWLTYKIKIGEIVL